MSTTSTIEVKYIEIRHITMFRTKANVCRCARSDYWWERLEESSTVYWEYTDHDLDAIYH